MEVIDALTYPTVSFVSKSVTVSGDSLQASGDLTFHGQTKPVMVFARKSLSNDRLVLDGGTDVSLTAFGIDRPTLMMIPVHDTINIAFKLQFPLTK